MSVINLKSWDSFFIPPIPSFRKLTGPTSFVGYIPTEHNRLAGRSVSGCHPTSSIYEEQLINGDIIQIPLDEILASRPILHGMDDPDYHDIIGANRIIGRISTSGTPQQLTETEVRTITDVAQKQSSVTDTTSGRGLIVGAFGLSSPLLYNNINNDREVGRLYRGFGGAHAQATPGTNPFPTFNGSFGAFNVGTSSSYMAQIAVSASSSSPKITIRGYSTPSWSSWVELGDVESTVAGSGTASKVAFWSGTNSLTHDWVFHWDNTNKRLGIGTSSPGTNLHVSGSASQEIRIASLNSDSILGFYTTPTEYFWRIRRNARNLRFEKSENGGSTWTTNVFFGGSDTYNGRIGIGTITPFSTLHLRHATQSQEIRLQRDDGVTTIIRSHDTVSWCGTSSNHPFRLITNNSDRVSISSTGDVGIGTTSPAFKFDVNGQSRFRNNVYLETLSGSISFSSGIFGIGSRWDMTAPGGSFFEIDNMRVRNELRAHIFKKDIVKASNAYLFVSDAAEIAETVEVINTSSTFKVVDDDTNASFTSGSLLWAKNILDDGSLQITGVKITVGNVVGSGTTNGKDWVQYAIIAVQNGGTLHAGDTIVRVSGGNIMLDASSEYSPFIDIYDGVTSWGEFQTMGKVKGRIGNLSGITDNDFPEGHRPSGYGIYTNNGFFKGKVIVTGGNATTFADVEDEINRLGGLNWPLNEDLEVYYSFDEEAGTDVFDSSLSNNDGVITHTGDPGTAFEWSNIAVATRSLRFNSVQDTAVEFDEVILPNGSHSISLWLKWNGGAPSSSICPLGHSSVGNNIVLSHSSGAAALYFKGVYVIETTEMLNIYDGKWWHLIIVANGTAFTVYLNGENVYHTDDFGQSTQIALNRLGFIDDAESNDGWNGWIDEFRLYSRSLSISEVRALYGLKARVEFEELMELKQAILNLLEEFDIPDLSGLGDLAWEDVVEWGNLGNTIIDGGYIKTDVIDVEFIRSTYIGTAYIEGLELNFIKGTIGGLTIAENSIYGINAGFSSQGDSTTSIRFWAGATYSNRATAPFRVQQNGKLFSNNAEITGIVTIIAGSSGIDNFSDAGDLATKNSVDLSTLEVTNKIADNISETEFRKWAAETGAVKSFLSLDDIPDTLEAPAGSGLFLSSSAMGYYTGGNFVTYIANNGDFKFGDPAVGNGIFWNQVAGTLGIRGQIVVEAGSSGYDQLSDIPTELADINAGEGGKLTGISSGADVTSTIISGGLITTGTIQVVQGGSVAAGITGNTSGDTAVRFWAGSSFANRATAPFRVLQDGSVTMTNATLQSSASGKRIVIDGSDNNMSFFVGADTHARILIDTDLATNFGSSGTGIKLSSVGDISPDEQLLLLPDMVALAPPGKGADQYAWFTTREKFEFGHMLNPAVTRTHSRVDRDGFYVKNLSDPWDDITKIGRTESIFGTYLAIKENLRLYEATVELSTSHSILDIGTTSLVRLNPIGAHRTVNSLSRTARGKFVIFVNVGSYNVIFKHETGTTASYRMLLGLDRTIAPMGSIVLIYDNVSSRWRLVAIT